jgi:acetyl esterase/lipase
MTSRHLVDPELLPFLETIPNFELSAQSLPLMRAAILAMQAAQGPAGLSGSADPAGLAGPQPVERMVPGPPASPDVRVLIYRPGTEGPHPAYLNLHGGGYVMGMPELPPVFSEALIRDAGCVVVSVAYRHAPETPFPGPLEDCYAALGWLYTNAAELGVDPARIAVGGESAGGGLAAALALLVRDRGEIPICQQLLTYPMLDDRTAIRAESDRVGPQGEFIWTPSNNRFGWTALLGTEPGGTDVSPYAAAARADNLAGLAPAFIAVGALDLFLDEDIAYARRLAHAGVPVEFHVYPGAYHAFIHSDSRVARIYQRDAVAALRQALGADVRGVKPT